MASEAADEARACFEDGVRLYTERSYEEALAKFRCSYDKVHSRAARQNKGLTLKSLGRYSEADAELDGALKEFPDLTPEQRATISQLLDEVRRHRGTIRVDSNVPNATVSVDGKPPEQTSSGEFLLYGGAHSVVVTREGFKTFGLGVMVEENRTAVVSARLEPLGKTGMLRVTEETGQKLTVFIDGERKGLTPWEDRVEIGTHVAWIVGEDSMGSVPASIDVREQPMARLSLLAEPLRCSVRVVPTPVNARVAIDGVGVSTGPWSGSLPCRKIRIDGAAAGFVTQVQRVALNEERAREREREVRIELDRDRDPE